MREPKPRNTAIDKARLDEWGKHFSGYVPKDVTEARLRAWIRQFPSVDQDLAARVLDSVQYFNGEHVGTAYKTALQGLPGWNINPKKRKGKWRFIGTSTSSGTSGDVMLHRFRTSNLLDGIEYDEMFITPSHLTDERLGSDDTLVIVDDLVGSGKQMCDGWNDFLGELTAGTGKIYLLVIAAAKQGRDKVHEKTEMEVRASHLLGKTSNYFAPECTHFSGDEKGKLLSYCKRAWPANPMGIGECGLGIVFFHRCPNVTLPILCLSKGGWKPLFPRHG